MKEKKIDVSMFWDLGRTLTYNCLFNFIVGNRGGGKTYGATKYVIDKFIKKKEQFGYIRRYKDDLKDPMEHFFDAIKGSYPDYEFKTVGKKFYIRLKPADPQEKWTEDDVAGYGFVLATASNKKSIAYPNITTLIFDEFLLDKGNVVYAPNEPEKLLNLYETIARPGTQHPRVVLFMLANALTVTNPYFLYFKLRLSDKMDKNGKYIWKHPQKSILVEDVRNEAFIDAKKNTEFGGIVDGTKYADYSIQNKFLLDDDTFVEKKSKKARYYFTFVYKEHTLGVWIDTSEGKMWVSKDIDPSCIYFYSLTLKDHNPNTMFLKSKRNRNNFNDFIENYKMGNVYFESINIKNITYEVIQMSA